GGAGRRTLAAALLRSTGRGLDHQLAPHAAHAVHIPRVVHRVAHLLVAGQRAPQRHHAVLDQHLDPVRVHPRVVEQRLLDVLPDLLVRAAPSQQPLVVRTVAVPRGAVRLPLTPPPPLRRTAPPRLGAGLPPRPRPRRRDPLRPQPVAVLVVVIGAAVPPAAHVPLAPFELELVPRVQPRSQLPRLVRTATPQCAAEVSHAITVVHAAAPPGVLTLVSGSGWLLGPAESFVAGVPLLVVESHDPSSVLGETLGRDRPSGI